MLGFVLAATFAAACGHPRPDATPSLPAATAPASGLNAPAQQNKPFVILISLDGFRADYFDRFPSPSLQRLARRGARARAFIPVFPTKTFPNHYSVVTGLHPERHGLVGNSFFDPARKARYSISDREAVGDGSWYRGEPIWVTAERQGMVAACFFWPGSEAAIAGIRPSIWHAYDSAVTKEARVDTVIKWLELPVDRRPHVVTLYFSDVDSAAHRSSVGSPQVEDAIKGVDDAIGRLLDGIQRVPVRDQVYVVVTSDHGMADTRAEQRFAIEQLIDMSGIAVGDTGPVMNLHVNGGPDRARSVRDALNGRLTHGRAYLRQDVPARMHYRKDPRIGDVVVIMDEGYMLEEEGRERRPVIGMHGWDNVLPSMHGVFLAAGPGIRAGTTVDRVEAVDVYPFLAEILRLRPAPDLDGRAGRIRGLIMADRDAVAPARYGRFTSAAPSGSRPPS